MYSIKKIIYLFCFFVVISACSKEEEPIQPIQTVASTVGVINSEINTNQFVVFADESKGLFTAFSRQLGASTLTFELSNNTFPIKLIDNEGREWDVFGNGASESNAGQQLKPIDQLVGYWFFFPSFFGNIEFQSGVTIDSGSPGKIEDNEWLIDTRDIQYGSFRDGIRSIDKPVFIESDGKNIIDNVFYSSLESEELVTVFQVGNNYKIYPHRILEYHEIVNDFDEGNYSTISYCPLTGTSRVWSSKIDGELTEFGVSGLLYNNNLVLYDRNTDSHWSQILNLSVNGNQIGEKASTENVFEIKYSEISKLDGEVLLLDPRSGNFSSYSTSQYDKYLTNDHIFFPLAVEDQSLPPKERVVGVTVGELTKVFRFSDFK